MRKEVLLIMHLKHPNVEPILKLYICLIYPFCVWVLYQLACPFLLAVMHGTHVSRPLRIFLNDSVDAPKFVLGVASHNHNPHFYSTESLGHDLLGTSLFLSKLIYNGGAASCFTN